MAEDAAAPTQAPPGMVHVPAGPFLFGRRKQEVTLGEFWIDRTPVTNEEYARFCETFNRPSPRHWPPDGILDDMLPLPVVNLTYAEAEAFAELTGKQLPTPAQYEKAARGTDGRKYPWGNSVGGRVTNTRESGIGELTPVEMFAEGKSPYGCLDMAGNVLHWTRGIYDEERETRVLKGSSHREFLGASSWSYEGNPAKRSEGVGFRCVWMP